MISPFSIEEISTSTSTYELKRFRVQHDEVQLSKYLIKQAKNHNAEGLNKIYLVRNKKSGTIVAWFGLKSATLPYNDKDQSFLIPAIELTHFAVDARFKINISEKNTAKTGEYIFWNFIIPIVQNVANLIACKTLFLFAINTPKLIKYYKTILGFKEIQDIDDKVFFEYAVPDYDSECKFLYFPLR